MGKCVRLRRVRRVSFEKVDPGGASLRVASARGRLGRRTARGVVSSVASARAQVHVSHTSGLGR